MCAFERSEKGMEFIMSKILEEEIYGKVATPKRKIIGEFIEKYVILALIPWIIYRIGIYIITDVGSKTMQEEQFSISSILNYYNIANDLSYKILFFSIVIVLAGLLVVILSSMLVLKKYRLKSEDINSVMKAIIAIQIIFLCITTFFYFISYNNEIKFNSALGSRFEWLSNQEDKKNSTDNYDVKKYITDIENCYQTNLVILLVTNFSCTVLEVVLQKKILENNSY